MLQCVSVNLPTRNKVHLGSYPLTVDLFIKVASLENFVIDKVVTLALLPPLNLHYLLCFEYAFGKSADRKLKKLENEVRRGS